MPDDPTVTRRSASLRRPVIVGAVSVAVALVVQLGCEREKKSPPPALPPLQKGLTVDDVHIAHRVALAVGSEGESSLRITVSVAPLSCDELRAAYPERPAAAGTSLDFWLSQPLRTDGTRDLWRFRSAVLSDRDGVRGLTAHGAVLDDLLQAAGEVTVSSLELAFQDGSHMIGWTGDLVAKDCGRVKRKEKNRPQDELELTVAGDKIAIHGASMAPKAGKTFLRLTRAPHDCDSVFTEGFDFYLDLALTGEPLGLEFGALQGGLFPGDPTGSKGRESFLVKVADTAAARAGATKPATAAATDAGATDAGAEPPLPDVNVELDGALDLSGYETKLKGRLSALQCRSL